MTIMMMCDLSMRGTLRQNLHQSNEESQARSVNSVMRYMEHDKQGAKIMMLENDSFKNILTTVEFTLNITAK